ncbi:glycoside hydrolase family 16 protein [Aulographum hederae CBS 113979]|uniref:endo-1,3(4)-beta-glucanase n=1 Tax=Aulographum hederae CBS 113979 TaxID=1176131 RepID=A0A6G1HGH5_9PEZI|nr:glycoside hydrolase family 16 protein [Aulographum hederae CBS 113979]
MLPQSLVSTIVGLVFFSFLPPALAQYALQDDYSPATFLSMFKYFTGTDPTSGHVQYVNQSIATSRGYTFANSSSVYIGPDTVGVYPRGVRNGGRPSVRLESLKNYNHGLFILDLAHMPVGCGTWPAFWTLGPNWPNNGEIDIIEGVNKNMFNAMTLHTSVNCTIAGGTQTGKLVTNNCAYYPGYNVGCGTTSPTNTSYGAGFNAIGGGVYAMEWTSFYIRIWFFPRGAIPLSITSGIPNPATDFGLPNADFRGNCNIDDKFKNHTIIFNIDFCGDYAGPDYSKTTCPQTANLSSWDSCVTYVGNNPQALTEAYFLVNSLKVYQQPRDSQAPPTLSLSSVVPAASTQSGDIGIGPGMGGGFSSSISSFLSLESAATASTSADTYIGHNTISSSDSLSSSSLAVLSSSAVSSSISSSAVLSSSTVISSSSSSSSVVVSSSQTSSSASPTSSSSVMSPVASDSSSSSAPSSSSSSSPAPSSSPVPSSSPSSSHAPTSSAQPAPTCLAGASNGQTYVSSGGTSFLIECDTSYYDNNLPSTGQTAPTFQDCIDRCSNTAGCVALAYNTGRACYLKKALRTASHNVGVSGARLVAGAGSVSPIAGSTVYSQNSLSVASSSRSSSRLSSSSSSSRLSSSMAASSLVIRSSSIMASSTRPPSSASQMASSSVVVSSVVLPTASIPPAAPTPVTCYDADAFSYTYGNTVYVIDCGIVYPGNMIGGVETTPDFEMCIQKCSADSLCVVAQYNNGACAIKSSLGSAVDYDLDVWSARLIVRSGPPPPPSVASSAVTIPGSSMVPSIASSSGMTTWSPVPSTPAGPPPISYSNATTSDNVAIMMGPNKTAFV